MLHLANSCDQRDEKICFVILVFIVFHTSLQTEILYCKVKLYCIDLWLYGPLVGPRLLFQFLNPIHSRYYSLDGGSAHRTEQHRQTSMPWVGSNPRSRHSSEWRQLMRHLHRRAIQNYFASYLFTPHRKCFQLRVLDLNYEFRGIDFILSW
jgi:hypothetical protein